jgi:hypothetical protein
MFVLVTLFLVPVLYSLSRHVVPRNSLTLVVNILFVALMYD